MWYSGDNCLVFLLRTERVIGKVMCGVDSKVMKLCVVWTVRW